MNLIRSSLIADIPLAQQPDVIYLEPMYPAVRSQPQLKINARISIASG
jgi:hypothetical protein